MQLNETNFKNLFIIENNPIQDVRGSFSRWICTKTLQSKKINFDIKQVSSSFNKLKGTLRGLHYQNEPFSENKIVTC